MLAGVSYAPAADQPGSTAISMNDSAFVGWATGWSDYTAGTHVDAIWQTPEKALGGAVGDNFDVVSLGRGGVFTLTFDRPIANGPGWDFAVFENGVSDTFLELGFVEVSSDGTQFVRFPNDSLTQDPVGSFGTLDPTKVTGYASKYRQGFGTPFDLEQLVGLDPGLDVNHVTHVRIVDVIGDGSVQDSNGDPIFDPYPTTGSAGVDVDAVGVLHYQERTVHFEDVGAGLPEEGSWSGPDPEGTEQEGAFWDTVNVGSFESGGLRFSNIYSLDYGSWNGWAYANTTDTTTPGYDSITGNLLNPFSAYTGSGAADSRTYAVASMDITGLYPPPTIERTAEAQDLLFQSLRVTNTTYAALSMLHGDSFAEKFERGSGEGDDSGDYFKLIIEGKDAGGASLGTVDFYLADYGGGGSTEDYIVDTWTEIDISSLATAAKLEFSLESSDNGTWGMNTPGFFAVDDILLEAPAPDPALTVSVAAGAVSEADAPPTARLEDVGTGLVDQSYWNGADGSGGFVSDGVAFNNDFDPTWASWAGWAYSNQIDTTTPGWGNQYSAYAGGGVRDSATYAVAYTGGVPPVIELTEGIAGASFQSLMVTNTTYAALAMLQGDAFTKKFGGADGSDPDWFLLTIEGLAADGQSVGTVDFYLADYRAGDPSEDYIVDTWTEVDLAGLAGATQLTFACSLLRMSASSA